ELKCPEQNVEAYATLSHQFPTCFRNRPAGQSGGKTDNLHVFTMLYHISALGLASNRAYIGLTIANILKVSNEPGPNSAPNADRGNKNT
ncbi:MAG: hypothetical protein ACPIB6_00855, partial [Henriciella sp.]